MVVCNTIHMNSKKVFGSVKEYTLVFLAPRIKSSSNMNGCVIAERSCHDDDHE